MPLSGTVSVLGFRSAVLQRTFTLLTKSILSSLSVVLTRDNTSDSTYGTRM